MDLPAFTEAYPVPLGLGPDDVPRLDEQLAGPRAEDQPGRGRRPGRRREPGAARLEQAQQLGQLGRPELQVAELALADPHFRPAHRRPEPRLPEGFEQVVDRADFKGLERVLVIGRHEDGLRTLAGRHPLQDLDPAQPRHLHIQKGQVRPQAQDLLDRRGTVRAGTDHLDLGVGLQQRGDAAPRQRLIIDDQRADLLHDGTGAARGRSRQGKSRRTAVPPSGRRSISSA